MAGGDVDATPDDRMSPATPTGDIVVASIAGLPVLVVEDNVVNAEMDDYLIKPLKLESLRAVLSRYAMSAPGTGSAPP